MKTTWIVAYDFSDMAGLALAKAADMLGREGGGRLLVVHAHPKGTTGSRIQADVGFQASAFDLDRAYVADAERQLREDCQHIAAPGVRVESRVVSGWPAHVIAEVAEREGADLIITGSHGRRGLEHLFLGSVAEAILRRARCAVLVVKHR